jgi:hypothetical protein
MRRLQDVEKVWIGICLVSANRPLSVARTDVSCLSRARAGFRAEEGAQGGRECPGDFRRPRSEARQPLGAKHVRTLLNAFARVRLGRGATRMSFFFGGRRATLTNFHTGRARWLWRCVYHRLRWYVKFLVDVYE